jgi:hypothetical protein
VATSLPGAILAGCLTAVVPGFFTDSQIRFPYCDQRLPVSDDAVVPAIVVEQSVFPSCARRCAGGICETMAIGYQALLRRPQVQAALGRKQLAEAWEDQEFLHNLIADEGVSVLSLGFDTG